jgi:tetratricopeptide (TPR) repeat protein
MRRFLAVVFCLLLGAAVPAARAETFLVLPFFNVSDYENLSWIGESIAETVREALVAEGVLSIDREERETVYRRLAIRHDGVLTTATVMKVGEALDADQIVFGRFEVLPAQETPPAPAASTTSAVNPPVPVSPSPTLGTLRITAQILDLRRVRRGPEFATIGALDDLAALQNHLAWATLQFVLPNSSPSEEEFRKRRPPVRVDAVEQYIRGLLAANVDQKHRFFTAAARLDPRYSQPCFRLGKLHFGKQNYRDAVDWFERVSPADAHFREASYFKGISRFYLADFTGAQAAFAQVAREVPLNEVFNNLGAAQSRLNLPDAIESYRKALEGDSADPVYHFNLGYALWKRSDFTPAADSFRAALDRDPGDEVATTMLGYCLNRTGPRPGDVKTEGLERLKHDYQEDVYLQLRALLQSGKK